MARFGLDSDSDSASEASTSTARRSPSASAAPSQADESFASSTCSRDNSPAQDNDDDCEQAPPTSSLMQQDNDDCSQSERDRVSEDDDDEMADDTFLKHSNATRTDDRNTRSISTPFSRASSSRSMIERSPSRTPTPPPTSRRRGLLPPSTLSRQPLQHGQQQQHQSQPWAQKPKLDPSRVAVMQASFFHQAGAAALENEEEADRTREREREEREKKRRVVEAGLAGRSAVFDKPPPAAAAPQPVPTPVLDPAPFRSYRTYERVPLASSVVSGKEGNVVDSGLAVGRSCRVAWGPRGEIVSLKGVYGGKEGKSDTLKVERIKLLAEDDSTAALRLLQLQLSQTEIFPPSSSSSFSSPAAVPSSSLRFSHFADLFSPAASSSPSSEEAQLFKLASVLFDEIPDLALPTPEDDPEDESGELQTPHYRSCISALRRRDQLSKWLESAVAAEVEADLRTLSSQSSSSSSSSSSAAAAKRIFTHLSGHQLSLACDTALSTQNLHLATLLSQLNPTSPPDPSFSQDVFLQISKWNEYRVDAQISKEVRKVYEVLAGNLGISEGRTGGAGEDRTEEVHVLEGLGWKRVVGMGVWYGLGAGGGGDAGVSEAVRWYEEAVEADQRVAKPTPSYVADTDRDHEGRTSWAPSLQESEPPQDPAFHLLKLFTSPIHPLSSALLPRNFGTSPTDYRLTWHFYVLFSRVLRRRDFEDREEVEAEGEGEGGMEEGGMMVEGNSVTADRVTVSYAEQLERAGQWEWAAFVLLHLELEGCRTKAIKELLARHTEELEQAGDEGEKFKFVTETLKIPAVWIWSALADRALSSPLSRFGSYTLLLRALRPSEAHTIAVEDLVPEAIVRGDVGLVRRLLEPFVVDEEDGEGGEGDGDSRGSVEGWEEGGQVYLLYLHLLTSTSHSLTSSSSLPSTLLPRTISAVQSLSHRAQTVPKLKGNKKLRLAVGEMMSRLAVLSKASAATATQRGEKSSLTLLQPSLLPESDRAVYIQAANRSFWEGSLGRVGVQG
ncbi:hypothetical protein JCM11641_004083 [Rhodosporidiobolus odoratus]